MYGFSISKKGILTDNYYEQKGEYEKPEPQGVYVMIRKIGNEIIINQDFHGSFGLYIYQNLDYFALSNSFLLLEEHLIGKQNISFNKDFADYLIISGLCSLSIDETIIKEIKQIPTNAYLVININKKIFKIHYIDYKENTIPLESSKGLKIIDEWIDKWGYIFRSLKKKTDNISFDLSGGFDTRVLLSILLNSGVDLNEIYIHSFNDKKHDHNIDFKIASDISSKFGFKLNNFNLDINSVKWGIKNTLYNTLYSKLGFHKEFYLKNQFYIKPRFTFAGSCGEDLRGFPGYPIEKYIEKQSSPKVLGHKDDFYNSSKRLIKRSVYLLKSKKVYKNDYEISNSLYSKVTGKNHFGKLALESFIANIYTLQPLMDPDIKKIKYDISSNKSHDLIAYIYVRFANDLINFPFQGNRSIDLNSIKKAKRLNKKLTTYKIKKDYNANFYIDQKRACPVPPSKENGTAIKFLENLFESPRYISIINKIYDNNVYIWANYFRKNYNYFPLKQHYALLAVVVTINNLSSNKSSVEKFFFNKE